MSFVDWWKKLNKKTEQYTLPAIVKRAYQSQQVQQNPTVQKVQNYVRNTAKPAVRQYKSLPLKRKLSSAAYGGYRGVSDMLAGAYDIAQLSPISKIGTTQAQRTQARNTLVGGIRKPLTKGSWQPRNQGERFGAGVGELGSYLVPFGGAEKIVTTAATKVLPKLATKSIGGAVSRFGVRRGADVASGQLLTPSDRLVGDSRLKQAGADIALGGAGEGLLRGAGRVIKTVGVKTKANNVANLMDAPYPTRTVNTTDIHGIERVTKEPVATKRIEVPVSDFEHLRKTGNLPKQGDTVVKDYRYNGTVTAEIEPETGKLVTWRTDNPNYAKFVQENKLKAGFSTRDIKPSEGDVFINKADFKSDNDWFNFGREVNRRWRGGIVDNGEGKYEINQKGLNRLSRELKATPDVIKTAFRRYKYQTEPFTVKELTKLQGKPTQATDALKSGDVKPTVRERGLVTTVKTSTKTPEQVNKVLQGYSKVAQEVTPKVVKPMATTQKPINIKSYVKEMTTAQQAAKQKTPSTFSKLYGEFRRKMVDKFAPIEDVLAKAEKQSAKIKPTEHITNQLDRVLRTPTLAGQFARDNGLETIIKNVDDYEGFNQYLIARRATKLAERGIETGRDIAKDKQLVAGLSSSYEGLASEVTNYANKLLNYATDSGLIDKNLANALKKEYPEYVPINRIMEEVEGAYSKGKAPVHLSSQSVVQKLKGSEREIENPLESLLSKTNDAFKQGEANKAAKMLASYKELPAFKGMIEEVEAGKGGLHSFSFLDNGVKRTFKTTPEIATAAKNLDYQQLGLLGKIFSLPTRVARLGITALNPSFVGANVARDQITATINSNRALQTSLANPINFVKSFWDAIGHGKEYQEWIRAAGGGTSFDIAREQVPQTIKKIRAGRNIGTKTLYTVTHPSELLRAAEDIMGRAEELTRLQQFRGTKATLLKEGMSEADATILAAKQSREASVNFARSGEWGKVLNSAFLYINAGIQGSRTLLRNLRTRPLQTAAKIVATTAFPVATVTAWNLGDEKRKLAYQDIPEWEKESNIIIVPPNPTRDEQGRWNVIKIPLSQEIASLTGGIRKPIEATMAGMDNITVKQVIADLFQTVTSFDVSTKEKLASTFTPQAIKGGIESFTNKNFFTGKDIVPEYLQSETPANQKYDFTTATASKIGEKLNVSPIKIEALAKSYLGGMGQQVLHYSDKALAAAGIIKPEEVQGEGIIASITRRFNKAYGREFVDKAKEGEVSQDTLDFMKVYGDDKDQTRMYYAIKDYMTEDLSDREKNIFDRWYSTKSADDKSSWETIAKASDLLANPNVLQKQTDLQKVVATTTGEEIDPLYLLSSEQQREVLNYTASKLDSDGKKAILARSPWLEDFWDIRSDYFDRNSDFQEKEKTYYTPSDEEQKMMDAYNKLPYGTGARSSFIDKYPQIKEVWQKLADAKNQTRIDMGLPALDTSSSYSNWGSYKKKKKSIKLNTPLANLNFPSVSLTAPKAGTKPIVSLPIKKGGANVKFTKLSTTSGGKARKKALRRGKSKSIQQMVG